MLSLLLGRALEKVWVGINACQIIYFMPLMNIPFPKLLIVTLKYLDFANGDVTLFEEPIFNRFINMEEIIDKPVSKSFSDYNY